MTLGGAYASREEAAKGSIATGKLADFVVLGADPFRVAPDTIKDIEVLDTYVGGVRAVDRMPWRGMSENG